MSAAAQTGEVERRPRVVLVFGSTGTAGSGAVRACLENDDVVEVRAVTRRSLGIEHDKLTEVRCRDFSDLSSISDALDRKIFPLVGASLNWKM